MSTFRNLTDADLWLQGPDGSKVKIGAREEFEASNYFKRYTSEYLDDGEAFLALVTDDGTPWSKCPIPNFIKAWEFTVATCDEFTDHQYDFALSTMLGGNARFVQITVDDQPVEARINSNADSVFRIDADSVQIFNTDELLVEIIEFKGSSLASGDAKVRLMAATDTNTDGCPTCCD